MDKQRVASELVKMAKDLTADNLWQKVARQYGGKVAMKLHSELVRKADALSDDKRLNPDGELWVSDFIPELLDGVIDKLKEIRRRV